MILITIALIVCILAVVLNMYWITDLKHQVNDLMDQVQSLDESNKETNGFIDRIIDTMSAQQESITDLAEKKPYMAPEPFEFSNMKTQVYSILPNQISALKDIIDGLLGNEIDNITEKLEEKHECEDQQS